MKIKTTENLVLKVLEENKQARTDDFVLYGGVIKRMGIDLRNITMHEFLATAKQNNMPPFATCTRCRRHIQELRQDLKDDKTAIEREKKTQEFKDYNISGL